MIKNVLTTFTIGGFVHEFCIVDYEYLKSLSKHPKNRPSGDIDDNIAPYLPEEVNAAKKQTEKLCKRFKEIGFDPNVKTIIVGDVNGINYKLDAQHTIAAIRTINEESLVETGKIVYDMFKCEIIHFNDNEVAFLKMLEKFNNLVVKYKPQDYAQTAQEDEIGNEMRKIATGLGVTLKSALILMYGNLTSTLYENLTMNRTKKNYNKSFECMYSLFNEWDKIGAKNISDIFRKGDAFIVLVELLADIFHKTYLDCKVKGLSEESSHEYTDNLGKQLINHMLKIDQAAFLGVNKKTTAGVTRKMYYKSILKQLLLNRSGNISKEYRESVRSLNGSDLKTIIEMWSEEGKNGNNGYNKISD